MNIKQIKKILATSKEDTKANIVKPKRTARVIEAKSWKGGKNIQNPIYQVIYIDGNYTASLGKPGKEADKDFKGPQGINKHDMKPVLFYKDEQVESIASFEDIFRVFKELWSKDADTANIVAMVLFRMGFLIDHMENADGNFRYSPNKDVLEYVDKKTNKLFDFKFSAFLHYLDLIAWNEDVKYDRTHNIHDGTGGRNNILTYVHLLTALLDKTDFVKFASGFARPPTGLSNISQKKAFEVLFDVE